ncbi:MAG: hypothetical protein KDC83_10550 [Flavobacteriales bacterium]|nr:hypothetical protein [Flavobacteriales bacterium]
MLRNYLLRFYPFEIHLLIAWSALALAQKFMGWQLRWLLALLALDLCFFYLLYYKVLVQKKEDSSLVKVFPKIYGTSLSLLIMGITMKLFGISGIPVSALGMVGILVSCVLLFHTPIQDKYLPVLKEFMLRTAIVLVLAFVFSM